MRNTQPHVYNHQLLSKTVRSERFVGETDEFSAWQKKNKEKLASLLGLPFTLPAHDDFKIEWEEEHESFREVRFTFMSEEGYYVPCHLCIPKKLREKPATVICLQGHSTGMHISFGRVKFEGDSETIAGGRDFALQAIENGYYAVTVEQRGMGECGGDETGPQCHVHTMANLLIGRTTIGERVWDISRTIDVLERHFPKRMSEHIVCLGNSGGGTATFYASCLEDRIKTSVVSCAFCTYDDSIAAMFHCTCNFIPGIRNYYDMGDLSGLIAPKNLIVIAGEYDDIFPKDKAREAFYETERLYSYAGGECKFVVGDEGHRFYPDLVWPVVNEWIQK